MLTMKADLQKQTESHNIKLNSMNISFLGLHNWDSRKM